MQLSRNHNQYGHGRKEDFRGAGILLVPMQEGPAICPQLKIANTADEATAPQKR